VRRHDERRPAEINPHLSVVIPCRNAESTLAEQLDALALERWEEPWEVVVVDNGSTDRTRDIAAQYADRLPSLRVLDGSERSGPAHAMNVGALAARAPLIAFCDSDDVIATGWVRAMATALRSHGFVAALQETRALNPEWVAASRRHLDESLPRTKFAPYAVYAGAGTIGIRRDLHERVGGFDANLGAMFEIDYALRLREIGIEPTLAAGAVVHYRWRTTPGEAFRQGQWYADGRARLERRLGVPRLSAARVVRSVAGGWLEIVTALPKLGRPGERLRTAWSLGWQVGRLRAAARHRRFVA
jgi:glycosyltransferase involved in cell wall biosynthesis